MPGNPDEFALVPRYVIAAAESLFLILAQLSDPRYGEHIPHDIAYLRRLQLDLLEGLNRNVIDANPYHEFMLPAKTVWNIWARIYEAVTGPRGEKIPETRDTTSESDFAIQMEVC